MPQIFYTLFRLWSFSALLFSDRDGKSLVLASPYPDSSNDATVGYCCPMWTGSSQYIALRQDIWMKVYDTYPVIQGEHSVYPRAIQIKFPDLANRIRGKQLACNAALDTLFLLQTEHPFYQAMYEQVLADPRFGFVIREFEDDASYELRSAFSPKDTQIILSERALLGPSFRPECYLKTIRHDMIHAFLQRYDLYQEEKLFLKDLKTLSAELRTGLKKIIALIEPPPRHGSKDEKRAQLLRNDLTRDIQQNPMRTMFSWEYKHTSANYQRIRTLRSSAAKKQRCRLSDIGLHISTGILSRNPEVIVLNEWDDGVKYRIEFSYKDPIINLLISLEDRLSYIILFNQDEEEGIIDKKIMGIVEHVPPDSLKIYFPSIFNMLQSMLTEMENGNHHRTLMKR